VKKKNEHHTTNQSFKPSKTLQPNIQKEKVKEKYARKEKAQK